MPPSIDNVCLRPVGPNVGASSVGVALEIANLDDDACQRLRDVDRMNRIPSRPFPGLGAGRIAFSRSRRFRLVLKHVRWERVIFDQHALSEPESAVLDSRLNLLTKNIAIVSIMGIRMMPFTIFASS